MRINELHEWDVDPGEALDLQRLMSAQIQLQRLENPPQLVGGADVSYSDSSGCLYAAIVICELPGMQVRERVSTAGEITFPYRTGLLSFREMPGLCAALKQVENAPDVIICDGQGIAHPRGFGLACHLGLFVGRPTIGCAKTRLVGKYRQPGPRRGDSEPLLYKKKNIGLVCRTKDRVKPVFVSPGFQIDIPSSFEVIMSCVTRYRLPEPVRLAHLEANRLRLEYERPGE